ncbi:MAG: glutamate--tRNA ligase [Flavobacteriales bacterium]|nr:glutamate--tRNA ligase [Flavobacteriales bacterium]
MERRVRVRFAPSPTGPLHIGGVRTALYNYLFARKNDGDFLLRIEDTDQNRFVPGAEEYIIETFKWLGLKIDEGVTVGGPHAPYRQSERQHIYRQYAEQLVADDKAYYAFDTTEELDAMREKLEASKLPAKYDAASRMSMKNSLTLSEDEVKERLAGNQPYVIRIKLPRKEEVRFHDVIRGWVVVQTSQMDDKVLFKSDGMPTYHLANIVDDYLMKITHVIRGEEWLPSAPLHVLLYKYLGWEDVMPQFAHLPLLLKPEGNGKLSKRDGDKLGFPVFPLEWKDPSTGEISSGYRESGYLPEAVINMLSFLGWHPKDNRELFGLNELFEEFTLERVSKNGAKFDLNKALWFNHQYLQMQSNEDIAQYLIPLLSHNKIEAETNYLIKVIGLMKSKVNFANEIPEKGKYFFIAPNSYDQSVVQKKWKDFVPVFIEAYLNKLKNLTEFKNEELEETFKSLCSEMNLNAGHLMQPLRVAVSGELGGPPIFELLEVLGKDEVIDRLQKAVKNIPVCT